MKIKIGMFRVIETDEYSTDDLEQLALKLPRRNKRKLVQVITERYGRKREELLKRFETELDRALKKMPPH